MAKSLRDIVKTVTPEIEQSPAMPPEKAKEKEFIDQHRVNVHGELPWDDLGVTPHEGEEGPFAGYREPMHKIKESIEVDLEDLTEEQLEILSELSRGFVQKYRSKASDDLHHGRPDGSALRKWNHADTDEEGDRFRKRNSGISLADKKLGRNYTKQDRENPAKVRATNEEIEIDEAHSTKQLKQAREYHQNRSDSYVDKRAARKSHLHRKAAKIATKMLQKRAGDQDSD